MRPSEFIARQDGLAFEDEWLAIPERRERLLAWIGRDRRVLDVGCGGGKLALEIRRARNQVTGVELNPAAARAAEARGIPVVRADVEEGLPFADASFEVVHAGSVLESLFDTRQFLEECGRVLVPGGELIALVRNVNEIGNRWRVLAGGYPAGLGAYPEDHHGARLRAFNREKARELLETAGFAVEETVGLAAAEPSRREGAAAAWLHAGLRVGSRLAPGLAPWLLIRARRG